MLGLVWLEGPHCVLEGAPNMRRELQVEVALSHTLLKCDTQQGVVRPILISNAKCEQDDVAHLPNLKHELQRQCVANVCAFHQPSRRQPRGGEVDVVMTWVGMVVRPFEVGGSFFVIWDRLRKSRNLHKFIAKFV